MELFWEARQQFDIRAAEAKAADASAGVSHLRGDLRMLSDSLERMALVQRAMWELLGAETGLSEKDLAAKVREIDLRDGKEDGRLREVRRCAQCQRTLQRRHIVCLYCGAKDPDQDPLVPRGV